MFGFSRKRRDKKHSKLRETVDSELLPNPRLRPRNFAKEQLPDQLRAVQGSTDPQVIGIVVSTYLEVIDPRTGQPWNDRSTAELTAAAVAREIGECQQEAVKLSEPEDKLAQRHVQAAAQATDLAESKDEADRFLDETVEYVGETRCSAREALASHQADRALAAEREADGDTEHSRRPLEFAAVIVGAAVFALLDMLLLWRPILGLDFVRSAPMLLNWVIAIVFMVAQAMFVAVTLRNYRERERESRDRRDAILDHNRAVHRDVEHGDPSAAARRRPDRRQLDVADRKLLIAQHWLMGAATTLGLIAAVRVALLARRDGDQSVLEATFYGAIIGLILGGLVLLLGWLSCRGNKLGDQLRKSAKVAEDIEERREELRREVVAARDAARDRLDDARTASNDAAQTRDWAVHQYGQAILLASQWLHQPPSRPENLIAPREPRIAEQVSQDSKDVIQRLGGIDSWLDCWQPTVIAAKSVDVARSDSNPQARRLRAVKPPREGEPAGEVSYEVEGARSTADAALADSGLRWCCDPGGLPRSRPGTGSGGQRAVRPASDGGRNAPHRTTRAARIASRCLTSGISPREEQH